MFFVYGITPQAQELGLSCDIHAHAPAPESFTNFLLYPFLLQICYANCLGHGHGSECHSPRLPRKGTHPVLSASTSMKPEVNKRCPISLLRLLRISLLRFLDSRFPGDSLWAWEFHPLNLRFCLSQILRNSESLYGDWPYSWRERQAEVL